jgi:hypothetical protein
MKVKVETDLRSDVDKIYDAKYNKMVSVAKLNPRQATIVKAYVRDLLGIRIHEVESCVDIAWLIALIESEGFGTDPKRGATRLLRVQQAAVDIRNEAYGHKSVDANGILRSYDGCGLEHLQTRLARYGCEYDPRIGDEG